MSNFTEDLMRIGPAPTLARETVMLVANLAITAGLVAVIVVVTGEASAAVLAVAGGVAVWIVLRWVYAATRTPRSDGSPGTS